MYGATYPSGTHPDNPTTTASWPFWPPDVRFMHIGCPHAVTLLVAHLPSTVSRDHSSDSTRALQAIALVHARRFQFSYHTPSGVAPGCGVFTHWLVRVMITGKHQIQWPESSCICFRMAIAWRESGTYAGYVFLRHAPKTVLCRLPPGGGDGPDFVPEIDLAPAGERSSLERINRCNVSTTASRVNPGPADSHRCGQAVRATAPAERGVVILNG